MSPLPRTDGPEPAAMSRLPLATYRVQLHHDFGFDAARALLPYLQRLGISHVYCSPIAKARPGSLHGYDVVDPAQINPELGGREGFVAFAQAARALGLGLLIDQVPNHMGVFGADNAWWMDVLEHGPASAHADWFDIDWQPPNPALDGKLLLPLLGAAYGEVLERGEIVLQAEAETGMLVLRYHAHRMPLDPRGYPAVLQAAARPELGPVIDACRALPPRDAPGAAAQRRQASRALQQQLALLYRQHPAVAQALDAAVAAINREPDRERLHALHEAQAWRLADWRMAGDEINYRRFFDVNALAALRIEDERVFEAVQGLPLELAAQGFIDGLRIDHPDGLRDPAGYFERLQQGFAQRLQQRSDATRPLYVVVEKITAAHEELPRDWAVHGSTGYRFAQLVNGLFVERRHALRMERIWRSFSGESRSYAEQVHRCKRMVAHGALAAQLSTLTRALQHIALADRRTRDWGFNTLRDALAEVAAAMPVYRTYVVQTPSAQDRRYIDWAIAQARRRARAMAPSLFDFVRQCLLAQAAPGADAAQTARLQAFAMAFQQFCAPLAAKGVEDTAFYRYHRLVSLNEVGGDPAAFGVSAAAFHGASRDRHARWPHTLLATSTHDHKRSEDVRCRIDVLSEAPAAWRLALRRWQTQTRSWRIEVDGELAPSPADLMLLYQTLLGTLPADGLEEDGLASYRERIEGYMLKAAREAKQHTHWVGPNVAYEAALLGVVRGLLGRLDNNPVLADLQARAGRIAWFGALNSLSMTALKFCSPGVPDLYQGSELVELSLVDPDNRRPVDYGLRERWLAAQQALPAGAATEVALADMARSPDDGRLKLWITWRLLALRRSRPGLLVEAGYDGLRVRGSKRRHVIAFARRSADATLLVAAGRKFASLGPEAGVLPLGSEAWADTTLQRPAWLGPAPRSAVELLSGCTLPLPAGPLEVARLFARLPFAALLIEHGALQ